MIELGSLRDGLSRSTGRRAIGPLLLLAAIGMRVNNALRYPTASGFDAAGNIRYIGRLTHDWSLPSPDALWASSHPPFFYYACAAIARILGLIGEVTQLQYVVPLMLGAASIAIALMATTLVRRSAPNDRRRRLLAMGLLLFLPVSVYMSTMFSEETLAAFWTTALLVLAIASVRRTPDISEGDRSPRRHWLLEASCIGFVGGLGLLTKLSGVLALAAVASSWTLDAMQRGWPRRALLRIATMLTVAALVGGWFYLRNLLLYGYLYPQDLPVHAVMFGMPPGEREVLDYLRLPLATLLDPQLLDPDLLHSVWGSTYATIFFDGHRHFLPNSRATTTAGRILLLLSLLPTAAFLKGFVSGARRALHEPGGPDRPLVLLLGFTLAGYVAFTWGNPWFVTLKGSYLLGLSLPFAYWASEVLADWTRAPGLRGRLACCILLGLLLAVIATFTFGPVFAKADSPGLPWKGLRVGS